MKPFLLSILLSLFFLPTAFSQVTRIDDNHNLTGFPLNTTTALFVSGIDSSLWKSDGNSSTQYYTAVKADLDFGIFNGKMYFSGMNAAYGEELWVTDGTVAGTSLVADLYTGDDSSKPSEFISMNGDLYFFARHSTYGRELFKIEGSDGSVQLIRDVLPGTNDGVSVTVKTFVYNGLLYFTANDGTHGEELWVTDGNTTQMLELNTHVTGFAVLNGMVIVSGSSSVVGMPLQLFKTDGTPGGTTNFYNSTTFFSGLISSMVLFNNYLYFSDGDGTSGLELARTNGSTVELVADIEPGIIGSSPVLTNAVILNSHLVFLATTGADGPELWISDGVPGGTTTILKEINPNPGDGSNPILLPVFAAQDDLVAGSGIYSRSLNYNGYIFFIADDGANGQELWKTDGAAVNTQLVKNINTSGDALADFGFYVYTKSGFIFNAFESSAGNELWITDGATANTNLLADVNPGVNSSNPGLGFFWNSQVYFYADDGNGGATLRDVFKLDGIYELMPVTLTDFEAHAQGNSVLLQWVTSSEVYASHFMVQRSIDGAHFNTIRKVAASGFSNTIRHYQHTDSRAGEAGSDNLFYRLLMADKDGNISYSPIENVTLQPLSAYLKPYPNPVKDKFSIVAGGISGPVAVRIVNLNGAQLYYKDFEVSGKFFKTEISVSHLPAGIYLLQVVCDGKVQTRKLVIE